MSETYRNEQPGYVIVISLVALVLILIVSTMAYIGNTSVIITTILVLAILLFYKLTVTVDKEYLRIRFGIGLIRKKFRLSQIRSVQIVQNRWYHGWGIHLSPDGWVFNVSGWDAIELTMKNGAKYRIGTNDPKRLYAAIHRHI